MLERLKDALIGAAFAFAMLLVVSVTLPFVFFIFRHMNQLLGNY